MEKKKNGIIILPMIIFIIAAVAVGAMACYINAEKTEYDEQVAALQADADEMQGMIKDLRIKLEEAPDETQREMEQRVEKLQDLVDAIESENPNALDIIAHDLFKESSEWILASRLSEMYYFQVAHPRVVYETGTSIYSKRDILYSDVVKFFSEIFTGELLEDFVDSRFIDIDGYAYCMEGAGSGLGVRKIKVYKTSESGNKIQYRASFRGEVASGDLLEEEYCSMTIKYENGRYRVSQTSFY